MPPSPRSTRLRPTLVAGALLAGLLVAPVTAAAPASAAACPLPPVLCGAPETAKPVITGTKRIGETVMVAEPKWDQADVRTSYQWMRDNVPIEGATQASYTLTSADFEEEIKVQVTGRGAGFTPGTAESDFIEPAKGLPITATTKPTLTGAAANGTAAPGTVLTATPGTWSQPEPTFTYQWYRTRADGSAEAIKGASTETFTVRPADAGRKVLALVVADAVGYERGAALTPVAQVPKAASRTSLTITDPVVRRREAPQLRIVLTGVVGQAPTGVVTVLDGSRRVRSVQVPASARGVLTVSIPRQRVGSHRLTARYSGDVTHAPSTSPVAVLKVRR